MPSDPTDPVRAAFEEYERRLADGESVDFDQFCRERPEIADALRGLRQADATLAQNGLGMTRTEHPGLAGASESPDGGSEWGATRTENVGGAKPGASAEASPAPPSPEPPPDASAPEPSPSDPEPEPPTVNVPPPASTPARPAVDSDGAATVDAPASALDDAPTQAPQQLDELPTAQVEGPGSSSGVSAAPVPELTLGNDIGPYRLERVLGEGGFGLVFQAEQREPVHRGVALKVLKSGLDTREVIARFEAERQALANMEHPGIAKIYDSGQTAGGRPYFAMELVSGQPITKYCDENKLSVQSRLELFVAVCDAIQHAHQKAIIHRDIKPSNVLVAEVDDKPLPKIIDFGIAKATDGNLSDDTAMVTGVGQVIGTPAYMSPEQARADAAGIDTRTDVYSLGVLLYELLVGALPFDEKTFLSKPFYEIQRVIAEQEPIRPNRKITDLGPRADAIARARTASPTALRRLLTGDLEWILVKALAKEQGRRYQSASELGQDVRRHLDFEPVLAGPPSVVYRLRKFVRKYRVAVVTLTICFSLLILAAVSTWRVSAARFFEHQSHQSAELRKRGQGHWGEYLRVRAEVDGLKQTWQEIVDKTLTAMPVWERDDELAAWQRYLNNVEVMAHEQTEALLTLNKALEAAPDPSPARDEARSALAEVLYHNWLHAREEGGVRIHHDYYQRTIQALGVRDYDKDFAEAGSVFFTSDPPGAEVYCFRYVEHEAHLVPLPYRPDLEDPNADPLRPPFLQVERVDTEGTPFRPGDRLLAVNGKPVQSRSDLALALAPVAEGEAVSVDVESGSRGTAQWVPFPTKEADGEPPAESSETRSETARPKLMRFSDDIGIAFAGYPLDFHPRALLGTTSRTQGLEIQLPRGSYLFVLVKAGYAEARYPVRIPGGTFVHEARLLRTEDVPDGYVHIPAGPVALGGDRGAFQSAERDERVVPSFFLGRHEVTIEEYLEFLNDPDVLPNIEPPPARPDSADEEKEKGSKEKEQELRVITPGTAPPLIDDIRRELENYGETDGRVRLVPSTRRTIYLPFEGGRWRIRKGWKPKWPILGIPQHAAREYAHWKSLKDPEWNYRLPTDEEWEKAARGVDRRIYVWGNYMIWNYCWSLKGRLGGRTLPREVGHVPLDESVYGIRDLGGSVSEPTIDRPDPKLRFTSIRGGNWNTPDEERFRIATRNGLLPTGSRLSSGIRLVAERK